MKPGDPSGHGRYGYLDGDDKRVMCHECGKYYVSLGAHIGRAHGLSADEYRKAHGLPQRMTLISPELRRRKTDIGRSIVGSEAWEKLVAKRDPVAASHSRDKDAFEVRGLDVERQRQRAKKNIAGASKPITRKCKACGGLIRGRKGHVTCSPLCQRISTYEGKKRAPVEEWVRLREEGRTLQAIGDMYGVSHAAVRMGIKTYRRYVEDREFLAEHGPGEVPEKRA